MEKKQLKFGIVPKLLVCILLPLNVVLIIMGVFLGMQTSKTVDQIMSQELNAETESAANEVEAFFKQYYGISECLAATQIVRDTTTEETEGGITAHNLYGSLLETIKLVQQDNAEDINYIWIANFKTGELVQSDGTVYAPEQIDFDTRSWYKLVMEQQTTITTEAYLSLNGETVVTVTSPVFFNNEIVGAVGIDVNMQHITQILSEVVVGENGYIGLYDRNNQVVYSPDDTLINANVQDVGYSDNIKNAIINRENVQAARYTRSGNEYYGSTQSIDSVGCVVLGVMPVSEFTAYTYSMMNTLVIGIIASGVLLAIICVFIALSITKPLKRLDEAVKKLADGELDVAVDTKGRDEVAEVGANVARIVNRLKEYILYIDEISAVLNQIGTGDLVFNLQQEYLGEFAKIKDSLLHIRNTLTDTLTSISKSAEQVNAGAEQIANGSHALAQGATEQASSVQELSSSVQELSEQAMEEAGKAVEAGKFLEQIQKEVEKSNSQMETM